MELNLENKVFLISGGAKGIGAAISRTIVQEGGIAVIIDPSKEAGANLFQDLVSENKKVYHIPLRLLEAEHSKEAVDLTVSRFGRIDGVVNNAGANDGIGLEHGSPVAFRKSVEKNLGHYYDLVHFALPFLKSSKGSIVNISSKTAITGQGNTSGYTAAKGAQLSLTREWAVELLPYGIRVNAVIPAEVMTPLYQKWLDTFDHPEEQLNLIENRIPLEKRMTTPQEIANMVIFLLSDRSSHTTGQLLYVDGGYTHLDRAIGRK
ncbi:L-fucose dehydrogenase [Aquiflexum balticum DSM 16537]|uniref:L-fucose dehydrogenase n=1 Tax=Aquiflexum balticum DSM 16537 TaxID=758820 RepID=A0A1W2H7J3_9BACT|nr:SDR family oxidoreductase [Aquiflexum balticum]SMD44880.1 L-fucose dehydrogenase [Aquiflexum balticum DSM 16537]